MTQVPCCTTFSMSHYRYLISINYNKSHKSQLKCEIKHIGMYKNLIKLKETLNLDFWVFRFSKKLGFYETIFQP